MDLIVYSGPDVGKWTAVDGVLTIGREQSNDLVLTDDCVSARHALVRTLPSGALELTDLSSTNGTWLDGERVLTPARVPPGSAIQIGHNLLKVVGKGAPPVEGPDQRSASPAGSTLGRWAPDVGARPVRDAGPVAGGDIEMIGHQVAGRDLHYQEGFRIRSRMRPAARRLLHWGIGLFFLGNFIGIGAIIGFGNAAVGGFPSVSDLSADPDSFDPSAPLRESLPWWSLLAISIAISLAGLVMIIVALVMRRDQISGLATTRRR
jgi:hypothetical protein